MDRPTPSFPRANARTQRFTLGAPRNVAVSEDGAIVTFLRSAGPEDPVNALWRLDVASGTEVLVADPRSLRADDGDGDLPPEERARRERTRESAGGIVAYATGRGGHLAVAALDGHLVVADVPAATARLVEVPGPVYDPRPDPTGTCVAWVRGRALWVADLDDPTGARALCADEDEQVSWGRADFVAAEEMGRTRGHWWAPDGTALLVARVDESPVQRWWLADPAHPARPPQEVRYPAAGTANADVGAWIVGLDGTRREVAWDRERHPYLATCGWDGHGPLLSVQARDQREVLVLAVDPASGGATELWRDHDDAWVDLVPGTPARLPSGALVTCASRDGVRRVLVDDLPVTPATLDVSAVLHVDDAGVVLAATPLDRPEEQEVWRAGPGAPATRLGPSGGVSSAAVGGATVVVRHADLEGPGTRTAVEGGAVLASHAARPPLEARPRLLRLGPRGLSGALLLPTGADPDARLPVLLDPYGGPHAQRVVRAHDAYLGSQWFADQGFAVLVVDGRGTPGRGAAWERAVAGDLATAVLEDQVDALHAAAEVEPRLDLGRVGIRGWSFGGYLAALAVLRRPDVFHAAVAGAPVTEWRLYDTHYTERYLGHPGTDPGPYDRSSLLGDAPRLRRPLLLVHGLADDNVVAAHTLELSGALLAAGRPHQVLPLTGVTHVASQEDVAENLLLLQLDFLRRALGIDADL
ncbi:MAG: prolyl oligopeptidase family serine peptidase [Acidimicrobiia bacterium]